MKDIKLSVIIPVYNVEKYLRKCLDSIITQTLKDIEIIVVNDGSTDRSLEILEEYQSNDNRIIIISQKNAGLSAARNIGIAQAQGKFIAFIDSDDYVEKEMLATMYNKAEVESSDIVMCNFDNVDETGKILSRSYISGNVGKGALFSRLLAAKYYSVAWANIYKRSIFTEHSISYPIGLYHEDVPTTYKLFFYAKKISVVDNIFYHWLQRKGSISKSMTQKHIDDTFKIYQLTKDFLIEKNILMEYNRYFIRRVFHFTVGLIGKINYYSESPLERYNQIFQIIQKMKADGYETEASLKILEEYDPTLYKKYIQFVKPLRDKLFTLDECKAKLLDFEKQKEIIERADKEIERQIERVETRDKEIARQIERVETRDKEIARQIERVETRDKEIARQIERVETRDKEIARQIERVETRDKEIAKQINNINVIKIERVKVTAIRTLTHPIKKYKAYKNLLKVIYETKS